MKHPVLFDAPKDRPSRKQLLDAFKAKHGIESHNAIWNNTPDKVPWTALHLPTVREQFAGYGVKPDSDMFDCISKVCRLLDDCGLVGYGRTERDAVREVCEAVGIPFNP